ncbi:MAG TPA: sulfur carrier protein ThiS [Methylovirgula sp.]|nr:sulfur carrier protein ThiS [Methylovirgula sp.]
MNIEVNGKRRDVQAATLAALLEELGYEDRLVATALNRNFVRAADRQGTELKAGDAVEILVPRQGG